jgi:hypothetical protein
MNLNLHKETYQINDLPCTVVANFADETINIHAPGYSQQFPMSEYTNYTGNMLDFATDKLNQ